MHFNKLCRWWTVYTHNIQSVRGKKETKMFFLIPSIKLRQFWWNLIHSFLNKFAAKDLHVFHLTWIMSLHYLVELEILIMQVLPLHCQIKKLQNLSHLNYSLQIGQIWIQLITACWHTAREGVQNMHHWSGWTETATENGVDQVGSRRHSSSHSSVASSIAADQWCMCCITLLQY